MLFGSGIALGSGVNFENGFDIKSKIKMLKHVDNKTLYENF